MNEYHEPAAIEPVYRHDTEVSGDAKFQERVRNTFGNHAPTPSNLRSLDYAALAAAVIMALGPLTVYSVGG